MNEWEWNLLEQKSTLDHIEIGGLMVKQGSRVRLHPREGGDIFDLALRGQIAIVEAIEEDYEGMHHLSVVLEDDPGRDLGLMRQPGHRFFFTPEEVEPIAESPGHPLYPAVAQKLAKPRILIAGVGNIFLGDDGFGVEVARRLMAGEHRSGVQVVDFGIRGLDLAYAMQDGYETIIIVDAYPHGQRPGTIRVIEPDLDELKSGAADFVQPHAMHPVNVLRMARAMGPVTARLVLVGCEPADLGGENGRIGLSPAVGAAIDEAIVTIGTLIELDLNNEPEHSI